MLVRKVKSVAFVNEVHKECQDLLDLKVLQVYLETWVTQESPVRKVRRVLKDSVVHQEKRLVPNFE